jgi:hypothetical protein
MQRPVLTQLADRRSALLYKKNNSEKVVIIFAYWQMDIRIVEIRIYLKKKMADLPFLLTAVHQATEECHVTTYCNAFK